MLAELIFLVLLISPCSYASSGPAYTLRSKSRDLVIKEEKQLAVERRKTAKPVRLDNIQGKTTCLPLLIKKEPSLESVEPIETHFQNEEASQSPLTDAEACSIASPTNQTSNTLFSEEEIFLALDTFLSTTAASTSDVSSQEAQDRITFQNLLMNPPQRVFSEADDRLFGFVLNIDQSFRSPTSFVLTNMNDFKCVFAYLRPSLGALWHYLRFEYDYEALLADCRGNEEDIQFLNSCLGKV